VWLSGSFQTLRVVRNWCTDSTDFNLLKENITITLVVHSAPVFIILRTVQLAVTRRGTPSSSSNRIAGYGVLVRNNGRFKPNLHCRIDGVLSSYWLFLISRAEVGGH
jgi:hypothetical protein